MAYEYSGLVLKHNEFSTQVNDMGAKGWRVVGFAATDKYSFYLLEKEYDSSPIGQLVYRGDEAGDEETEASDHLAGE